MWRRAFQKERAARDKMSSQPGKCAAEGPTGPAPRDGCREAMAARVGRALMASLRSPDWILGVVETTVGVPTRETWGLEAGVWRKPHKFTQLKPGFSPGAAPACPGALGAGGGQAELVLPCTQALCLRVSQLSGFLCDRRVRPHRCRPPQSHQEHSCGWRRRNLKPLSFLFVLCCAPPPGVAPLL